MQSYVLQTPSLQRLAAVKTVTRLWSQPDIITLIATSFDGLAHDEIIEFTTPWQEIEKKVQSRASALSLPEPCKKELSDVILPIGMEIVVWCQYHNLDSYPFKFLDKLLPLQFCWTMLGTIDYLKTTELIVKDERCDVVRRFEVACLNCLEDEARLLFQFLPNHQIHKYINEAVRFESLDHRILVAYFACTLSGDEDLLQRLFQTIDLGSYSINQYLFAVVLYMGSRETCEYFLQKVSREEKEQVLEWWEAIEYRNEESPTCSLIFYLSRMNEELFAQCTADVLIWLLRWPVQSLFLQAAKRGWPFMVSHDCARVLHEVILKIVDGYNDYDYAQWFRELWRLSPVEHKQYFFNDTDRVEDLFETKRTEFIRLCLNRAPSYQLRELVECRYDEISDALRDESVISEAALVECKEKAAVNSSNKPEDEEKRLRSEWVCRLVDFAMEQRIKRRETAGVTNS